MQFPLEMRRADADADKAAALKMMAASLQVCSKFKCSELSKKFPGSKYSQHN